MEFADVPSLSFTQDYFRVEAIVNGNGNEFTWVLKNGETCTIRTRLVVSKFFQPTFRGKPRPAVIAVGVAVLSDRRRMFKTQNVPFRVEVPVESTRMFTFVSDYNLALLFFAGSLFILVTLAIWAIRCIITTHCKSKSKSGSFPSQKKKVEAHNVEEITRIFYESESCRPKQSDCDGLLPSLATWV